MKTKKISKMLKLNKETISNLELKRINGGEISITITEPQITDLYYTVCDDNSQCSKVAGTGCTGPKYC